MQNNPNKHSCIQSVDPVMHFGGAGVPRRLAIEALQSVAQRQIFTLNTLYIEFTNDMLCRRQSVTVSPVTVSAPKGHTEPFISFNNLFFHAGLTGPSGIVAGKYGSMTGNDSADDRFYPDHVF